MDTIKKHSKAADLLRVLGQKIPPPTITAPKTLRPARNSVARPPKLSRPHRARPTNQRRHSPSAPSIRGKAIQFYLHEPDEKLIREFAVWLAPHRKRINDSLVIKAILRAAKTGHELLAAYDAAVKVDGRTRKKDNFEPS